MEVATMQNITFVKFSELFNWSAGHLLLQDFDYNKSFPLVRIGTFLTKNKNTTLIQNDKTYSRVTVSGNNGGVRLRNTEIGKNIGTKRQFIVQPGQFIISKIDARNGAMGLIPEELDGAIVTNDFPTYNVDTAAISPQFLLLITTTKKFVEFAQTCSSGTTNRQRIDLNKFLDVQIPLPPLNDADAIKQGLSTAITQEKLVAAYNQKIKEAEEAKQNAIDKEAEIETYLYNELGIQKAEKKEAVKGLHFVKFKDIDRWDVWASNAILLTNKWNNVKLKEIISLKSGNFLPASKMINGNYKVFGGNGLIRYHKSKFLEGRRIIIGRVGAYCGNIHIVEGDYWVTDNALWSTLITDTVELDYLALALTAINLNRLRTTSAQPSIAQGVILEEKIPVPPHGKQLEIAEAVKAEREEIKSQNNLSEALQKQAIIDFENIIFKPAAE